MSDIVKPDKDNLPAVPDEYKGVGLEDTDEKDLITPRLQILHQEGLFEHPQTKQQWESFNCILLGMVKQRTLWEPVLSDKAKPLCRSYDFKTGHPDTARFPWEESTFEPGEFNMDRGLKCEDCELKEWDSHPTTGAPWCNEQHVYPLLIEDEEFGMMPVILTLSKTGIKPSRSYLNPFMNSQKPLFTVVTNLSLELNRKGANKYSVPVFERVGPSDSSQFGEWERKFKLIKLFLNTPRSKQNQETEGDETAAKVRKGGTKRNKPAAAPKNTEGIWDEDDPDNSVPDGDD